MRNLLQNENCMNFTLSSSDFMFVIFCFLVKLTLSREEQVIQVGQE